MYGVGVSTKTDIEGEVVGTAAIAWCEREVGAAGLQQTLLGGKFQNVSSCQIIDERVVGRQYSECVVIADEVHMTVGRDEIVFLIAEGHATEYRVDDSRNLRVCLPPHNIRSAGSETALVAAEGQVHMMPRDAGGGKR